MGERRLDDSIARIREAVGSVVVGQESALDLLLSATLAGGHALLEGPPGVGKTLLARTLLAALGLDFRRVQFTPDMLPSDLTGTLVLRGQGEFVFRPGPIFADAVLADEINRTPPKTQAALLEAMEERRVTADGERRQLPEAFWVIATQNPFEFEGTYPLPEAELDRFLLRVEVGYPEPSAEEAMVEKYQTDVQSADRIVGLKPVVNRDELLRLRAKAAEVRVDPALVRYAVSLVRRTREDADITLGASPRAGLALIGAARGLAYVDGRDFTTPDDVKELLVPVLGHRIRVSPEAQIEGITAAQAIARIGDRVPIPS